MNITKPDQVTFADQDFSCGLCFRVASPMGAAASALKPDLCRGSLATRLVDQRIQEGFSLTAPNSRGPAFDLKCKVDGIIRVFTETFLASPFGVSEFHNLSRPEESEMAKLNLILCIPQPPNHRCQRPV